MDTAVTTRTPKVDAAALPTTARELRRLHDHLAAEVRRIRRQLASKDRRVQGPESRLMTRSEYRDWRRRAVHALEQHEAQLRRVAEAKRRLVDQAQQVLRLEAEAALELLARETSPARAACIEAIRRAVRSLG